MLSKTISKPVHPSLSTTDIVQKKICMLGEFAVGKTSLVRRYVEGIYNDKYQSTIGVCISRKSVSTANQSVRLLLWDLAGGDDFIGVQKNYIVGLAGAIIVADLSRPETINAFDRYARLAREHNPDATIIFVGNKADMIDDQTNVALNELKCVAERLNGTAFFTSAKTGEQVEMVFVHLANLLGSK